MSFENLRDDFEDMELSMDDIYGEEEDLIDNDRSSDSSFDQEPELLVNNSTALSKSSNRWGRSSSIEKEEVEELSKLKNPPINTERTISLMSTSAPQTVFENFVEASLHDVVRAKEHATEENNVEKIRMCATTDQIRDIPIDEDPPFKELEFSDEEEDPIEDLIDTKDENALRCKREQSIDNAVYQRKHEYSPQGARRVKRARMSNLNLIRYDDDEQSGVVGSLPTGKYLKEVQKKRGDKEIRHKGNPNPSGYKKQRGKFITINTLSFSHYLSPEAPSIHIGNVNGDKKLLITVGIHGDEPCGMLAFNELIREGYFHHLPSSISITALVGNPAAVSKGQRFIEYNLNRMIREDLFKKKTYESERARVVAQAINWCDVLLDLHSCSAKAPAHALPMDSAESVKLASQLPVGYVIKYLAHTTKGRATTLDWAQKKNKVGVCVECGQHKERATIDNAKRIIQTFIEINADLPRSVKDFVPPVVLNSRENEPVRKDFKFVRKVVSFEKVPFGEVIASDVTGPIISKYPGGTYIVMPTRNPVLGEEAFFYAEKSDCVFD